MMQLVTRLYDETVVEFIRRKGVANTGEIAKRFGWRVPEAKLMMSNMERAGLVKSVKVEDPMPGHPVILRSIEWQVIK